MKLIYLTIISVIFISWNPNGSECKSISQVFELLEQTQDTTSVVYWKSRAKKAELLLERHAMIADSNAIIAMSLADSAIKAGLTAKQLQIKADSNAEEAQHQQLIAQKTYKDCQERMKELEVTIEEQKKIIETLRRKKKNTFDNRR